MERLIPAINQSDLRKSVSYLGQETGIFSGSIRDNLTFGDESISDDHIVQAMDVTVFLRFKSSRMGCLCNF